MQNEHEDALSMKNVSVVITSESHKMACDLVEIFILKIMVLTEIALENVLDC